MATMGKKVFSSGTLTIGTEDIGSLTDVEVSVTYQTIPLQGNNKFPDAIAQGPASVKGSAKSGNLNPAYLGTITNSPMGPSATPVALTWVLTNTEGKTHTYTIHNVQITSYKVSAGPDKWLVSDISFEAAAAADGKVITHALQA